MDMEPGGGGGGEREPFKKGSLSPPPGPLRSLPPKLFDFNESLFAAFPFCQGTGSGVFS